MSPSDSDARDCPQCGARGVLPIHQDPGEGAISGTIDNPVMTCPVCQKEFRATGMTWLGPVSVADLTDDQIDDFVKALVRQMATMLERQSEREDHLS